MKGIWAKNIVDTLVEVPCASEFETIRSRLIENGYICMSSSADRLSFNKGYTENGFAEKVFHLHLRIYGDNDELYFRDYLSEKPEIAQEYEKLKLRLWKEFEHGRDEYTKQKTEFIKRYTKEAKLIYRGRY